MTSKNEGRSPGVEKAPLNPPTANATVDNANVSASANANKTSARACVDACPQATRAFLDQLFGAVAHGAGGKLEHGQLAVWSGATKQTKWCDSLDEATAALAEASNRGEDVYLSVALHNPDVALEEARKRRNTPSLEPERVRGCARSAVVLGGIWSDEDHADGAHQKKNLPPNADAVLEYLKALPAELAPSLIVDSGGGFYPWWLFREPWVLLSEDDRQQAAALVVGVQRYIRDVQAPQYSHDSTHDLARVLRPPGVVNHKYGKLVRIVDLGGQS